MTAYRVHHNREPRTAHPPLPRQPTMTEWIHRERKPWWKRLIGGGK